MSVSLNSNVVFLPVDILEYSLGRDVERVQFRLRMDLVYIQLKTNRPVKKLLLSFQQKMMRAWIRRVHGKIQKIIWSHKQQDLISDFNGHK